MALSNQPYFPLYVQDYMTNQKLAACNAESHGVYNWLICLMHKSETYGKILLKQKHEQSTEQILNFAHQFAKPMPFTFDEIYRGLTELHAEGVVFIEGNFICQKRMIKDYETSISRSESGKKSVETRANKGIHNFKPLLKDEEVEKIRAILFDDLLEQNTEQPTEQNTENENEYIVNSNIELKRKEKVKKEKSVFVPPTREEVFAYAVERGFGANAGTAAGRYCDFFESGDWKDSNYKQVHSWKQKFVTWEGFGLKDLKPNAAEKNIIADKNYPPGVTLEMVRNAKIKTELPENLYKSHFLGWYRLADGNYQQKEVKITA